MKIENLKQEQKDYLNELAKGQPFQDWLLEYGVDLYFLHVMHENHYDDATEAHTDGMELALKIAQDDTVKGIWVHHLAMGVTLYMWGPNIHWCISQIKSKCTLHLGNQQLYPEAN